VTDPAYNPERFIPDTVSGDVDQYRCPVPPAEWGRGSMVRIVERRGWQWVAPPPPRARWEPMQPPATGTRPIAIGLWANRANGEDECTVALRDCGGGGYVELALAACDVATWNEPRPKPLVGSLALIREQAEYLRDALTAMLERKP
jgi:hypothetical protein